jgi:para-nitrobenzyl esterase
MSGASMERISTFTSADTALARGIKFTETLGVSSLEELRARPAADLIADFGACIDGYVLTESMSAIFEKGQQNDVPAIAGLVSDEGSSREGYGIGTVDEFIKNARETHADRADEFLLLYPAKTDEEAGLMSVEAARDEGRADLYEWAVFRAQTAKTPAYTYYFSRGIPWPEHPEFNAFHTGDVIYWFNNLKKLDRPWTKTDTVVAEAASSYLVNFVIKGDPNGEGLPTWPAFNGDKIETIEIGTEIRVIPVATQEKIEFFKAK